MWIRWPLLKTGPRPPGKVLNACEGRYCSIIRRYLRRVPVPAAGHCEMRFSRSHVPAEPYRSQAIGHDASGCCSRYKLRPDTQCGCRKRGNNYRQGSITTHEALGSPLAPAPYIGQIHTKFFVHCRLARRDYRGCVCECLKMFKIVSEGAR